MSRNRSQRHSLANKLTPIRVKLEKFLLDHSDGLMKRKSDQMIVNDAVVLVQRIIAQIDEILC